MSMNGTNAAGTAKLGFGLMRLPKKGDEVDMAQVCDMVDLYMQSGLNYFDTAYVYHGGKSESVAGEALVKRYPRESFRLATKLPQWVMKSAADCERIFSEQLERAGVDYFDLYLLHSIENEESYANYVKYGAFEWAKQKRAEGKIRRFGFSFHGTPELLERILDAHPEAEFVQIQLNYADWDNPLVESRRLYEILRGRGLPIIVMEPVKGGTLANVAPEAEKLLKTARPKASIASWALRFAASLDGVETVLSGMSDMEQMRDNLNTFLPLEPLTVQERALLKDVVAAMAKKPTIPCTGCRYCVDGCPQGIQIPEIFKAVNALRMLGEHNRPHSFYEGLVKNGGRARDCVACGQCEGVCPQHLQVVELLREASGKLDS